MTFTLRPYQIEFIERIRTALATHKRIIACAATGSGKSKVFISIANQAFDKKRTVLVLSESDKIYKQLAEELPHHTININAGVKLHGIEQCRLYLAMAQTLTRRPGLITQFAFLNSNLLIIADEAHMGTMTGILHQLPSAYLIGFTATPDARSAKHLPIIYKDCVIGPQPEELVSAGFLSPYRHFARIVANMDTLKLKNGEFTEESQEATFTKLNVMEGLVSDLSSVPYNYAMVFCASIKQCATVAAFLSSRNITCTVYHSKLQKGEASYNLQQFTSGAIKVCVSVGALTKGFDHPPVDLVILHRATTSTPLYCQMIGRGSRIAHGKAHFTVLDYGANFTRHGLWDSDFEWHKRWKTIRKKKDGVAPVKDCPICMRLCPPAATSCPECGYIFQKSIEEKEKETKLIEVTEAINKLRGRHISTLQPNELAIYVRHRNKSKFGARIAKSQEQKNPGWLEQYAKEMGYADGWVYHAKKLITDEPIDFQDIIIR